MVHAGDFGGLGDASPGLVGGADVEVDLLVIVDDAEGGAGGLVVGVVEVTGSIRSGLKDTWPKS